MKLKQIVVDKGTLTLTKEEKVIEYGKTFDIEDEDRVNEILNTMYKGQPVAEVVEEKKENKNKKQIKAD